MNARLWSRRRDDEAGVGHTLTLPCAKRLGFSAGLVSRLVKLVQRLLVPGQRIHATGVLRGNNQILALLGVFPSQRSLML